MSHHSIIDMFLTKVDFKCSSYIIVPIVLLLSLSGHVKHILSFFLNKIQKNFENIKKLNREKTRYIYNSRAVLFFLLIGQKLELFIGFTKLILQVNPPALPLCLLNPLPTPPQTPPPSPLVICSKFIEKYYLN